MKKHQAFNLKGSPGLGFVIKGNGGGNNGMKFPIMPHGWTKFKTVLYELYEEFRINVRDPISHCPIGEEGTVVHIRTILRSPYILK